MHRSSFYGLLDLLSGTELNPGQSEIGIFGLVMLNRISLVLLVQTAKQSCELLLKVISAVVDVANLA